MAAKKKTTARQGKTQTASAAIASLSSYVDFLEDLKKRIQQSQFRAAIAASRELVRLYWNIGREIVQNQEQEGWGTKVIDRLAADLQKAFPGMAGFSHSNIHRMMAFYLAYTQGVTDSRQSLQQSMETIVSQPARQLTNPSTVPDLFPPPSMTEIPWFHNVVLIEKLKNTKQRLWYAQKALQYGWSRTILVHQI